LTVPSTQEPFERRAYADALRRDQHEIQVQVAPLAIVDRSGIFDVAWGPELDLPRYHVFWAGDAEIPGRQRQLDAVHDLFFLGRRGRDFRVDVVDRIGVEEIGKILGGNMMRVFRTVLR